MVSQTGILVNIFFIIFVVFSCVRGFPSELKRDEEFFTNRQLLSKKECVKFNNTLGQREPKDM